MDVIVYPGKISGELPAVASKSQIHRLLIAAALSDGETVIRHGALCDDISATVRCLSALGARISQEPGAIFVRGIGNISNKNCVLDCGESGSTYRFLLPVASALGAQARFALSGRLPQRPVGELLSQMQEHGAQVSGLGTNCVTVSGRMGGGNFTLPGNVSSQYITALLFAMPLTGEDCTLSVTGKLESAGYVDLTLEAIRMFSVEIAREGNVFSFKFGQKFVSPGEIRAEGDWSNAAFALCAASACGAQMRISGLRADSTQGDKAVLEILQKFGAKAEMQKDCACVSGGRLSACTIDIGQIPDMAMAISLTAALAEGETVLANAGRLRLKESDRIESTLGMLRALGANAWAEGDEIHILGSAGTPLSGGTVDACGDHRIAMTAAVAAAVCENPVKILGAQCVAKSYPAFFEDIRKIGLRWEECK